RSSSEIAPAVPEFAADPVPRIWNEEVRVPASPAIDPEGPFTIEEVPLPLPNPWNRNVRPSDFDFFPDGRLALVTFDGDVWT
ncbi:MAG: hypothetical protein GWO24_25940, partial [Akkermansiaceae bacterium]|nr:hypothetical protein [Akkermansiaceae bacterium]